MKGGESQTLAENLEWMIGRRNVALVICFSLATFQKIKFDPFAFDFICTIGVCEL